MVREFDISVLDNALQAIKVVSSVLLLCAGARELLGIYPGEPLGLPIDDLLFWTEFVVPLVLGVFVLGEIVVDLGKGLIEWNGNASRITRYPFGVVVVLLYLSFVPYPPGGIVFRILPILLAGGIVAVLFVLEFCIRGLDELVGTPSDADG